jgi:hypothetical protein
MLEIKPVQTKDKQEKLAKLCDIEFLPDALAYAAYDGIFLGLCQFKFGEDAGTVFNLTNASGVNDTEALIIMGRAALNFLDTHGIHKAEYVGKAEPSLLLASGFVPINGKFVADMTKLFGGCGSGEAASVQSAKCKVQSE